MIDKNKIAKAARQISEKVVDANGFDDSKPTHLAFLDGHIDGFNAGAKWAINEFLKDLWHDGEEVPKEKNKSVLMWFESYSVGERELDYDEYYDLCNTGKDGYDEDTWEKICNECGWCSKWLYLDDLQKGGKQ